MPSPKRKALAPGPLDAFQGLREQVFAPVRWIEKPRRLIAVAAARTSPSALTIHGHPPRPEAWCEREEIMEAIWVASEMRAGAAYAHSALAIETMNKAHD